MIAFEQRASTIIHNFLRSNARGGRWILPANICPVVPMVFHLAKVPFYLVDVNSTTMCIDESIVLDMVHSNSGEYEGILFNHTYGCEDTPLEFFHKLKSIKHNLTIIDDRCLCKPMTSYTPPIGIDLTLFSTGYGKFVDIGFGGFAFMQTDTPLSYKSYNLSFCSDSEKQLSKCIQESLDKKKQITCFLDNWLVSNKPNVNWSAYCHKVETCTKKMQSNKTTKNNIYSSLIPIEVQFPKKFQTWRFNIKVKNKQDLLRTLFENGLFASSHYAPLNIMFNQRLAPSSETLHSSVINLFNDNHVDTSFVEKCARLVAAHVEN